MTQLSPKKIGALVGGLLGVILLVNIVSGLFATNDQGFYQVKQAFYTGDMTVRNTSGTYALLYGKVTTYHVSDMLYFSNSELDGKGESNDAITVRFNGGGTAKVSGTLKFRLSTSEKDQLALHQDFKTYESVKHDLIRQAVQEALNKTGPLMKAEEAYAARLADFTRLAEDQIRYGVFETSTRTTKAKDADGNEQNETVNEVKVGSDGKNVVYKPSPFLRYNIEVITFTIKGFEFDGKTQAIIDAKKEAEQARVVARANADRARQDAITTFEVGKASVAKAEADALVKKKTAVIQAEQETAVAVQARLKVEQEAKAAVVQGEADAKISKLKVQAGLTPLERATIQKETAIGVAKELSNVQFPSMMIIGGGGGSGTHGAANPFDAVGLESFMRISDKLAAQQQTHERRTTTPASNEDK